MRADSGTLAGTVRRTLAIAVAAACACAGATPAAVAAPAWIPPVQVPGSNTWKVLWTETTTPRLGAPTTTAWEAYLHLYLEPPSHADRIQANPLGVWVQSITWSQIASSAPKGARP